LKIIDIQISINNEANNNNDDAYETEQNKTRLEPFPFQTGDVFLGMKHGFVFPRVCHILTPEIEIRGMEKVHAPTGSWLAGAIFPAPTCIRKQGNVPSPLDGASQNPLVSGAGARLPARTDLPIIGYEPS
jgi:hypothetical protein